MRGLEGVRAGDELLLVEVYRGSEGPVRVVVEKVGRTLVHVPTTPGRPQYGCDAYRIADGMRNGKDPRTRLFTPAQWEERQERMRLVGALYGKGLRFDSPFKERSYGLEVLRGLLDALEGRTYAAGYQAGLAAGEEEAQEA